MKNLFKRSLAVALALVMCVSMLNLTAFAAPTCSHEFNRSSGSNRNENGYCMRTCTKCGADVACSHEDQLCGTHGLWNGNPENHGDGYCDYCHYNFCQPGCPDPDVPTNPGCQHDFSGDGTEIRAATCTQDAEWQRICSKCGIGGSFYTKLNSRQGHVAQVLTCDANDNHASAGTQAGTHSWICSRCNGTETGGTVAPANHTYGTGVKQSNGATRYTCTACGHWYEDGCTHTTGTGGDAHKFDRQVTTGDCANEGTAIFKCIYCDHEETRNTGVVADAHNYVRTDSTTIRQDGAAGHYWVCTRDANHTHTATEAHRYGAWTWTYTDWVDDTDDVRIQHREATGTRTCNDCGHPDATTVKHTDTDKKGLTDNDLTRQKGEKTFTVAYLVLNGGTSTAPLDQTTIHLLEDSDAQNVDIKTFDGYTFYSKDCDVISFADDEQVVVHVYYTRNSYGLTINYVDAQGNPLASQHTENLPFGSPYSVDSPAISGYQLTDSAQSTVSGTMPAAPVEVDVVYSAINYTLVVNYVSGASVLYSADLGTVNIGGSYAIPNRSFGSYQMVAGQSLTGTIDEALIATANADNQITLTVNYTYVYTPAPTGPVEIEDPETPLGPLPELPEDPEDPVEVDEPETPLGPLPELPEDPEVPVEVEDPKTPLGPLPELPGEVEIDEPETPLANVPQTGDNTMLWVTTAVASGAGLIWLAVDGKKRREDAE